MILKAPLIVPIDGPPIQDGAVVVEGETIAAAGPSQKIKEDFPEEFASALELRRTILMPGFVNAHSHLELTALKGLTYPGDFTQWVKKIVKEKPSVSGTVTAQGIEEGVTLMLQSGITTVGDHVSFNTDLTTLLKSPLRGILFIEVLGVNREVAEEVLAIAEDLEKIFGHSSPRFRVTASPHSVHALHPEILPRLFNSRRSLFSIHLGESEDEDCLFHKNEGPLFDLISQRGEPPHFDSPSALAHLESLGLLSDRVMAVHCNYLRPGDIELLSRHGISVVHCPASHAYFSHRPFPLEDLRKVGINIALGTDSLASSRSLSMLDQLRRARESYGHIPAKEWIAMATLGGARALKMENEVGSITPGKKADLIGIPLHSEIKKDPSPAYEDVFQAEKVCFAMIGGKVILE